jgi:hypothetical protein
LSFLPLTTLLPPEPGPPADVVPPVFRDIPIPAVRPSNRAQEEEEEKRRAKKILVIFMSSFFSAAISALDSAAEDCFPSHMAEGEFEMFEVFLPQGRNSCTSPPTAAALRQAVRKQASPW